MARRTCRVRSLFFKTKVALAAVRGDRAMTKLANVSRGTRIYRRIVMAIEHTIAIPKQIDSLYLDAEGNCMTIPI